MGKDLKDFCCCCFVLFVGWVEKGCWGTFGKRVNYDLKDWEGCEGWVVVGNGDLAGPAPPRALTLALSR